MIKRGEILRDASAGPGLLGVDGEHYQFSPVGTWRSPLPPVPGMMVEIDFAPDCSILSVTPLPISGIREAPPIEVAQFRERPHPIRIADPATLVAFTLLAIGWVSLPAVSIQTLFGKIDFTFWQVLGFLNSDNAWEMVLQGRRPPSPGLYGLLALGSLCGPLASYVWKRDREYLTNILPALFMIFVGFMLRSNLHSSVLELSDGPLAEVQRQAQEEISKAISISFGAYSSFAISCYLTGSAVLRFLAERGVDTEAPLDQHKVAA